MCFDTAWNAPRSMLLSICESAAPSLTSRNASESTIWLRAEPEMSPAITGIFVADLVSFIMKMSVTQTATRAATKSSPSSPGQKPGSGGIIVTGVYGFTPNPCSTYEPSMMLNEASRSARS